MTQGLGKRAVAALGAVLAIMLVGCSSLLTDLQEPNPLALRTVLADLVPPLSDVDFSISRVTAALGLAAETINGATIAWESSNPSVIASDGTIVRPPAGSDPIKVSVKAKVKWGTVTKEKVFEVTVAPMPAALADQIAEDRDAVQALPVGSTADTLVEGNLKLPTVGACGSTIAWVSSDTSLIANDGSVTRAAFGSADGTVTLTATITKDGQTSTKTIQVKVKAARPTASQAVDTDVAALAVSSLGTDTDLSQIKTSLLLPSSGTNGSTISWTSSDPTVIASDGTVTRPASGSGSKAVILTATVTSGTTTTTKIFDVTVLEVPATASASVSEDKANLIGTTLNGTNPDLSSVSSDFHLPGSGSAGTAITWESSDPTVISATGAVTQPSSDSGDKPVTLTATISKGGVTQTTTITVTVKGKTRYTVTFDSQSATTAATPTTVLVAPPATTIAALPIDPARTGYDFGGWWTGTAGTGYRFRASTAVAANITVYAKWTPTGGGGADTSGGGGTATTTYTVTFDGQSATTAASPATTTVTSPAATTVAALPSDPVKTGYTFGGWFTAVNGGGSQFLATTTVSANITVYAKWTATSGGGGGTTSTTYTVTFDGQSATTAASPATTTVTSPAATTVAALPSDPVKTGYTFGGWFTAVNGGGSQFIATTTVSASLTVYAKWTPVSYTVTYNLNSGTNSSSNPATYDVTTATITLAAPTRTGYSFGGWYTEVGLTNVAITIPPGSTGAKTFWAKWTAISRTVTYDSQSATTTASPTSQTVTYPATTAAALPAVPTKTGYSFGGWWTAVSGGGTQFIATTTVSADLTVYAKWTETGPAALTIVLPTAPSSTALSFSDGSQAITNFTVNKGSTFTVQTASGATITGWYLDSDLSTKLGSLTSLAIDSTSLALGRHFLLLDIVSGTKAASGSIYFDVVKP